MTTRQRDHQKARVAAGKCAREGCKEPAAGHYCVEHKREHRARMRATRAGR